MYILALGELIWLSRETSVLACTKQMCFTLPVSQSPIWLYQAVDFILFSASWIQSTQVIFLYGCGKRKVLYSYSLLYQCMTIESPQKFMYVCLCTVYSSCCVEYTHMYAHEASALLMLSVCIGHGQFPEAKIRSPPKQ